MLLKIGSKGDDVKKLQEKLGLSADGAFGPGTEKAVKKWQIDNDLAADGIVGEGTWNKMFGSQQLITEPTIPVAKTVASVGGLKLENLRGHIPDAVIAQIPDTAAKFEINTPLRLAHFLAQCGHESGGFKATQENLNYSASGLKGIFSKYFKEAGLAEQYQRNPQKIASRVRGYIQLTGKDNYTAFGRAINEDMTANPDKVATHYALLSAAWFFSKNGLHRMADEGASDLVVTKITKRVNGGTIGLPDRIKHFKEYYKLLA
jgi:putative chitinase